MKELRKRREALERKINKRQNWRQKARKLQKQLGKKVGKRLDGLIEALSHQIKALHKDLAEVNKQIEIKQAQNAEGRGKVVQWITAQVGVVEGSDKQKEWAADLGYSASLPWCSIFAAYALKHYGGFNGKLPSNPAYSGNWLTWEYGDRVSYSQVQPGDLLIFDWGDGGLTDHVATYVGSGLKVGGNENDRVEKDPVPVNNIVGVVRPEW